MKRVCIIGSAPSWKEAPFGVNGMEYWSLNDMFIHIPKGCTRWFQMHSRDEVERSKEPMHKQRIHSCLQWCQTATIPIYMQQVYEDIPASHPYPVDEVERALGMTCFNSSVDYMVALALYEKFDEIYLYGVNMAADGEYSGERPSLENWLSYAKGRGVKLIMPDGCDLMKTYFRYGYDEVKKSDIRIKLNARIVDLQAQSKNNLMQYYLALGAEDSCNFFLRELGD